MKRVQHRRREAAVLNDPACTRPRACPHASSDIVEKRSETTKGDKEYDTGDAEPCAIRIVCNMGVIDDLVRVCSASNFVERRVRRGGGHGESADLEILVLMLGVFLSDKGFCLSVLGVICKSRPAIGFFHSRSVTRVT